MSAERAEELELVECGRCAAPHPVGSCTSAAPRTELELIERLVRRVEVLELRVELLEGDRAPIDERELGEAALG